MRNRLRRPVPRVAACTSAQVIHSWSKARSGRRATGPWRAGNSSFPAPPGGAEGDIKDFVKTTPCTRSHAPCPSPGDDTTHDLPEPEVWPGFLNHPPEILYPRYRLRAFMAHRTYLHCRRRHPFPAQPSNRCGRCGRRTIALAEAALVPHKSRRERRLADCSGLIGHWGGAQLAAAERVGCHSERQD